MGDMGLALEPLDTGAEISTGAEEVVETPQEGHGTEQQDDPYSSRASKEYVAWLKGLRDDDPVIGKWARLSKDNHSAQYALRQLDPKGVDGVRERYALMDSVVFDGPDGQTLKGPEAIAALQDFARESSNLDSMIASGDPRVLEAFGDEFNGGLAKLAPAILDRVMQADPDAYAEAITPHVVRSLGPVLNTHNALVDLLQEKPPAWLPQDRIGAFEQDRMARVRDLLAQNGQWLNEQIKKAEGKLNPNAQQQKTAPNSQKTVQDERAEFEKQQQEVHWKQNIAPKTDEYASKRFQELFRPYQMRLKLPQQTVNGLMQDFVGGVVKKAGQNQAYMAQIGRYHAQRNPDPASVLNYFKVEFDKHAKSTMQSLMDTRYPSFLRGKANSSMPNANANATAAKTGPIGPKEYVVTVKPRSEDVDWRRTTPELRHQNKFRMLNGKIAVWQR